MTETLVSIYCLTYNHASYIRDALEGFLRQKTTFKYEVFIYDDASTDGTSEIIREYEKTYPDIFKAYISEYNRWADKDRRSFLHRLRTENMKSKYIALCEGDDYWTDENKLQIQVDYLEENPDCMMYVHNCKWLDCSNGSMWAGNPFDIAGEVDVTPEELIAEKNAHPPTASFVFRRTLWENDSFFFEAPIGDYPLLLCAIANGRVHYSSKIMSVYRYKVTGSYTNTLATGGSFAVWYYMGILAFLIQYNDYTKRKYEDSIRNRLNSVVSGLIQLGKDSKQTVAELYARCLEERYSLSPICFKLLPKLEDILLCEKQDGLSEEIKKVIGEYEHIIVMGTGKYAQLLTEQLCDSNIVFDGYAETNLAEKTKKFNGKRVWKLSDIPFDLEKTVVVVGILIKDWSDIENSLNEAGILNYCLPFYYNIFC